MTKEQEKQIIDKAMEIFESYPMDKIEVLEPEHNFYASVYIGDRVVSIYLSDSRLAIIINQTTVKVENTLSVEYLYDKILERYNAQKDMEKQNAINEFLNYKVNK
jgi:hypothetical protein